MRALSSLMLVAVVTAGCQTTFRTRVPFTGETAASARSCADACAQSADRDACLRACPGAVEEHATCAAAPDVPAQAACSEHSETDTTATAALVIVSLFVVTGLAIGYADNHCPFC